MLGTAMAASPADALTTAEPINVAVIPMHAPMGPAIAKPSGLNTNEPRSS